MSYSFGTEDRALTALLDAADLHFDETEFTFALEALLALRAEQDELPDNFAALWVDEVEKVIGLGLEPRDYNAAVAAVRRVYAQAAEAIAKVYVVPPEPDEALDAWLEMAYESRFQLADGVFD